MTRKGQTEKSEDIGDILVCIEGQRTLGGKGAVRKKTWRGGGGRSENKFESKTMPGTGGIEKQKEEGKKDIRRTPPAQKFNLFASKRAHKKKTEKNTGDPQ